MSNEYRASKRRRVALLGRCLGSILRTSWALLAGYAGGRAVALGSWLRRHVGTSLNLGPAVKGAPE